MAQYEIVINGKINDADMLTVLHYDHTDGPLPDFDAVATVIRGHLVDHMQTLLVPSVTYTGITVREDIPGGVGTVYPFSGGDVVGTAAETENANQLALQVNKNTNNGLRPSRGRIFQGGLSAGGLNGSGLWGSAQRTGCADYVEDIRVLNLVGGTTLQMVIKASDPTKPNTVAYNSVASIGTSSIPVTQRRRKIGVGT